MIKIFAETPLEMYRRLDESSRRYIRSIKRNDKVLQQYLRECAIDHEYTEKLIADKEKKIPRWSGL